ncbi:MAG: DUF4261 domain-containing protein [Methylobacteriaceae bacterium]|nr:DUF4261 domain-containing protein [Methylobacteriaceae bacterium]
MNQRFVCMLALEDTGPVSVHDLSDRLARMVPTYPMKIETVPGESLDDPLISLLLLVNEFPIAVMWVDRPIPLDTFDSAIRTNRLWPQARERLREHKAHITVGALDSCKSHQEAVQQATLVMLLSAALAESASTIGAYWCAGETVTEKSQFVDYARSLAAETLWPTDVWVQLAWTKGPEQDGKRTFGLFTIGLLPFVGRELEFTPAALPPAVICLRVVATAHYLISNGPVLRDGSTVGIDPAERIRIHAHDERVWPGVPFWTMTVEEICLEAR